MAGEKEKIRLKGKTWMVSVYFTWPTRTAFMIMRMGMKRMRGDFLRSINPFPSFTGGLAQQKLRWLKSLPETKMPRWLVSLIYLITPHTWTGKLPKLSSPFSGCRAPVEAVNITLIWGRRLSTSRNSITGSTAKTENSAVMAWCWSVRICPSGNGTRISWCSLRGNACSSFYVALV